MEWASPLPFLGMEPSRARAHRLATALLQQGPHSRGGLPRDHSLAGADIDCGDAPTPPHGEVWNSRARVRTHTHAVRLSPPRTQPRHLHSHPRWHLRSASSHPRRMAAFVTHRKTRVTHEFWGFLHLQADIPSLSRRGNLMVHVLSLLHSTDLHCKQSLGITLLSQLILSPDFQNQNSVLILLMALLMLHVCHHSGNPFDRNLLFLLH